MDLPYIATLYEKGVREIIAELGDLIYQEPDTGAWQTADAYLSGNVRAKLATAEAAGAAYTRNAEALRAVQPEDAPGRHRRASGRTVDTRNRHPGLRGCALRRVA